MRERPRLTWKRCTRRTETCLLVQKNSQLLEWAKNRINEVAAVMATAARKALGEQWKSSVVTSVTGDSRFARSPVRSRIGQTSEGSLTEWHAPFWRWTRHGECEWVETGAKDILDVTMKKALTKRGHGGPDLSQAGLRWKMSLATPLRTWKRREERWKDTDLPITRWTLGHGWAATGDQGLQRADRARLQEMTTILEERDHLEDITFRSLQM